MTVYLPKDCRTWRYSFHFKGTRYAGSTGQSTEKAAEDWEDTYRARLRREHEEAERRRAAGLEVIPPDETPFITDWAGEYMAHVEQLAAKGRVTRPERIDHLLRVVLRFWGARPSGTNSKNPAKPNEPYHHLRLIDPIREPDWIVRFEQWMDARGRAGQTRNQYRSVMRQMYELARQPQWRKRTGIQVNPFDGIYRDQTSTRDVTITPEDLRRLLERASYHVRLAVAIGALAPKLRLANILQLRWSASFDPALKFLTVPRHKTVATTKRPLVVPVSEQLRAILEDAKRRQARPQQPGEDYVVTYRGKPIASLRDGLKNAAEAAGLTYGRFVEQGLTFHTLRHTAATILAELDVAEGKRKSVLGHERLETTQRYTHLRPVHEVDTIEQLSQALRITDVVTPAWSRASRKPVSDPVKLGSADEAKSRAKRRETRTAGRLAKSG